MSAISDLPVREKAYCYILRNRSTVQQLLVFEHIDLPDAGVQVPGGTVEPGEALASAAQREAAEETGLVGLVLEKVLGSVRRDMRGFGIQEVHHRHYFLLTCADGGMEKWTAYEATPSDGSQGPIAFRFFWVELNAVPVLLGGMDEMLPSLRQRPGIDLPLS